MKKSQYFVGDEGQSISLTISELEHILKVDPSQLTLKQLKSELSSYNVSLPTSAQPKAEYVKLYKEFKHKLEEGKNKSEKKKRSSEDLNGCENENVNVNEKEEQQQHEEEENPKKKKRGKGKEKVVSKEESSKKPTTARPSTSSGPSCSSQQSVSSSKPSSTEVETVSVFSEGKLYYNVDNNRSYIALDGHLRHIPNSHTFYALFRTSLDPQLMAKIHDYGFTVGPPIPDDSQLIRDQSNGKVYLIDIQGGRIVKRHIGSPPVFDRYQFTWDKIINLSHTTCEGIPTGTTI